jgi:hypothetical protein
MVAWDECNVRGFAFIYFNSPFLRVVVDVTDGGSCTVTIAGSSHMANACVISRNAAEQHCFFLSSSYYLRRQSRVLLSKSKLMIREDSVSFLDRA